jgi:hypothetical protein
LGNGPLPLYNVLSSVIFAHGHENRRVYCNGNGIQVSVLGGKSMYKTVK